jgi:hypothetical protein
MVTRNPADNAEPTAHSPHQSPPSSPAMGAPLHFANPALSAPLLPALLVPFACPVGLIIAAFSGISIPNRNRKQLNTVVKTKRAELRREGEQIAAELAQAMKTGNHRGFDALQKRFDAWESATERLDFDESRNNITGKYASVKAYGGDLGSGDGHKGILPLGASGRGKDVFPLGITKKDARDAYEAVKR